jgi:hypothetical protein
MASTTSFDESEAGWAKDFCYATLGRMSLSELPTMCSPSTDRRCRLPLLPKTRKGRTVHPVSIRKEGSRALIPRRLSAPCPHSSSSDMPFRIWCRIYRGCWLCGNLPITPFSCEARIRFVGYHIGRIPPSCAATVRPASLERVRPQWARRTLKGAQRHPTKHQDGSKKLLTVYGLA